jgi:hypothetical protein
MSTNGVSNSKNQEIATQPHRNPGPALLKDADGDQSDPEQDQQGSVAHSVSGD